MPKATYNGVVLAESDNTEMVDGNHYFPADSINKAHFPESTTRTVCGWKGTASDDEIIVDGKTNKEAARYYPDAKSAAKNIEGHIAFWNGVSVE